ncbi:MAG: T9SS type A sorting domain-containing protein [bacterium]
MKHLINVCIIVTAVIVFLPLTSAHAEVIDLTTGHSYIQGQETVTIPEHKGVRQHAVLWDTTHGVYLNYQPFGRYNILVANLADSGFTMSTCGTGLHTVDLSQYDVIVITVGSSWNSSYTQEEIDSLVSYYNQYNQRVLLTGDMNFCEDIYIANSDNVAFSDNRFDWLAESGGILIMGDNPGCNNSNINPVANAFNMTAGVGGLSPSDLYFTNFAAHPVFNGITEIYYRAAGEVAATTPAAAIAWTATNQPTIAALDEFVGIKEGQVGIVGTSSFSISPNPFRHSAEIQHIAEPGMIRIYDVSGSLITTQKSSRIGEDLQEGVYFVRVDGYMTEKIIKLK